MVDRIAGGQGRGLTDMGPRPKLVFRTPQELRRMAGPIGRVGRASWVERAVSGQPTATCGGSGPGKGRLVAGSNAPGSRNVGGGAAAEGGLAARHVW